MPLYRFSTDDTPPSEDFAVEHPDDETALREAARSATEVSPRDGPRCRVTVWDQNGRLLK
jgi:hypothetical protein